MNFGDSVSLQPAFFHERGCLKSSVSLILDLFDNHQCRWLRRFLLHIAGPPPADPLPRRFRPRELSNKGFGIVSIKQRSWPIFLHVSWHIAGKRFQGCRHVSLCELSRCYIFIPCASLFKTQTQIFPEDVQEQSLCWMNHRLLNKTILWIISWRRFICHQFRFVSWKIVKNINMLLCDCIESEFQFLHLHCCHPRFY